VLMSLCFQIFWPKWQIFFRKKSGQWPKKNKLCRILSLILRTCESILAIHAILPRTYLSTCGMFHAWCFAIRGLVPASAEAQYLRKCHQLDTYGVEMHSVKGDAGMQFTIGISPRGIETFRNKYRIAVYYWWEALLRGFPWISACLFVVVVVFLLYNALKLFDQWFSSWVSRNQEGSWTISEESRPDVSFTQRYYICFIRVWDGDRWVIVGCWRVTVQKRLKNIGLDAYIWAIFIAWVFWERVL